MRLLNFDDSSLPKLLLTEMNVMVTNVEVDFVGPLYDYDCDVPITRAVGCVSAFVHRINAFNSSQQQAILMAQLFEVLKQMDGYYSTLEFGNQNLSIILDFMITPIPVGDEQLVEVMRCINVIQDFHRHDIIIFSGVLGCVAKKALEPTVSREQRASLASSTLAAVYKIAFWWSKRSALFEQLLVEQPFWTPLCELWGALVTFDMMSNIFGIFFELCSRTTITTRSITRSTTRTRTTTTYLDITGRRRASIFLRAGWAFLCVKALRVALTRRPLNMDFVLCAIRCISLLLDVNFYASQVALKKAGAVEVLREVTLVFPHLVLPMWDSVQIESQACLRKLSFFVEENDLTAYFFCNLCEKKLRNWRT